MPKFYSKAQIALREVWRTALRKGSVEITLSTSSKAHKLRFDLYAAVKEEKRGESEDLELMEAANTLEITKEGSTLIMRPKLSNETFQAIARATGMNLDKVVDPAEQELGERMLREIGVAVEGAGVPPAAAPNPETGLAVEHQENPFYKR